MRGGPPSVVGQQQDQPTTTPAAWDSRTLSLTGSDRDLLGADQPFSIDSGRRRFRLRRACPVRFAPSGEPLLQELPKATQFSKLRAEFLWGLEIYIT
jgi:hypothetical protein